MSKAKERIGEVQKIKGEGKLYDVTGDGKYKLTRTRYSEEELKQLLRTLGKRAQTRLKTLSRYFEEGGKKYTGNINPVYERYKGFNVQASGLSYTSLYTKVKTAIEILNSKQSTYTGYNQIVNQSYESFKKSHPKLKNMTFDEWDRYVKFMGAYQRAHQDEQFDSEQLVQFTNWADKNIGLLDDTGLGDIDLDEWFLDIQREGSQGTWLDLDEDFDDI